MSWFQHIMLPNIFEQVTANFQEFLDLSKLSYLEMGLCVSLTSCL